MKITNKIQQLLESGKDVSFTWNTDKNYGVVSLKKRGTFKEARSRYYTDAEIVPTILHCEDKLDKMLRNA